MAAFLAFTQLGATWPQFYAPSYILKTLIVPVMLLVLWPHYTKIRWNHWWLASS
jgi:hypothetical protein